MLRSGPNSGASPGWDNDPEFGKSLLSQTIWIGLASLRYLKHLLGDEFSDGLGAIKPQRPNYILEGFGNLLDPLRVEV